jgi:O-antigen ligase/tetratricopeptide (TPR) repeat protein
MPQTKPERGASKKPWALAPLQRITHIGLYLILLTPLFTWSGFLIPAVTAKVLGFQILVELVSAATLVMVFLEGMSFNKKPALHLSPVFITLSIFIGYSLLSAIIGVDLNRSLWGFIERQDGLVLLLHFFAWMATAAWFFTRTADNKGDRTGLHTLITIKPGLYSYLFFSFWVSTAVALTAIIEVDVRFEGLLPYMKALLSSGLRPGGVFGNPTMLGPYLLFHFFYGLYFLFAWSGRQSAGSSNNETMETRAKLPGRVLRYPMIIGVAVAEFLILIVILMSQTRGVSLGVVVGLLLVGFLAIFGLPSQRPARLAGFALILCLTLAAAVTWHYRESDVIRRIPILSRMTHLVGAESASTSTRLYAWRAGIRAVVDHPLFGWGHDNAYYALNKYYDPRLISISPFLNDIKETWLDKSHNSLIDLVIERGILGFLLYILLLGVIAKTLWWLHDRWLAICLAGGIAAYLVSNLVAFDAFGSLFGFFLSLAAIAMLEEPHPPAWLKSLFDRKRSGVKGQKRGPLPVKSGPSLKIVLVVVLLAAGVFFQVEIGLANHKCLQAQSAFLQDPGIGVSLYREAFEHFSPYNATQKLNCAYLIVNSVINKRQSSQSFDAGPLVMQLTRDALAAHPEDVDSYIMLNDMYNGLALYGNRDLAKDAEAYGKKALALSPKRQEAMVQLGRTYVILNEATRAIELNRRMLQDFDFALGHWYLALSLLQNNQRDEAKKEIRKAIEMGYRLDTANVAMLKGVLGEKDVVELTTAK